MKLLHSLIIKIVLLSLIVYPLYAQEIVDEFVINAQTNLSWSVLNGDWMMFPIENQNVFSGLAVLKKTNGAWVPSQNITRANTPDFGRSAASDGEWLVAAQSSGDFFFYRLVDDDWVFQQQIPGSYGSEVSLSISGEWAVAGFYYGGGIGGSISIFHLVDGQWISHGGLGNDEFSRPPGQVINYGRQVKVYGDYIATKAFYDYYGRIENAYPIVYIYKRMDNNSWKLIHEIDGDSYALDGPFDIALDDDTFIYNTTDYDGYLYGHVISFTDTSFQVVGGVNGGSVRIFNDDIYTGNPNWGTQGSVGVYRLQNGRVSQIARYTAPDNNTYLGNTIEVDEDFIYATTGYRYNLSHNVRVIGIKAPTIKSVSQGHSKNNTKIEWQDNSEIEDGFKIYRDGLEIATTSASARSYFDYDGIPGKMHSYEVKTYDDESGWKSAPAIGFGYKQPFGVIEGRVQTPLGAGINEVEVSLETPDISINRALVIDTLDNAMLIGNFLNFPDTAITISFWLKSNTNNTGTLFNYTASGYDDAFSLSNPSNLEFKISNRSLQTEINIADAQWHHLALTWRNSDGNIIIYDNGSPVFNEKFQAGETIGSEFGAMTFGKNILENNFLNGLLDELRIWKTVRNESEINLDMYKRLVGNEENLVSSFSFDDPQRYPDNYIADQVWKTTKRGLIQTPVFETDPAKVINIQRKTYTGADGKFTFKNVYFDDARDFDVIPFKQDHGFSPAVIHASLKWQDNLEETDIIIDDTTSFTVSGYVSYANTDCFLEGAEIIMDGLATGVFTNADGFYQITVEEPGNHLFEMLFANEERTHSFRPAKQNILVADNLFNINFENTTTSTLSGRVGAACGVDFGQAFLSVRSTTGCYAEVLPTFENGQYRFVLPAQDYIVEVDSLPGGDAVILESYNFFAANLAFQDSVLNFIYRDKFTIEIDGWPELCSAGQLPVVEQYEIYSLRITVLDNYKDSSCPVDTGSITIYDELSDNGNNPVTLQLVNGRATYILEPGNPNIIAPYQKLFSVSATVDGENATLDQPAIVTGHRPRSETFVTKTPELPLMILRDPPGDQSYAYLEKGHTTTTNFTMSHEESGSGGAFVDLKIGAGVPVPFTGVVIGGGTHIEGQIMAGRNNNHGTTYTTSFTQTERLTTNSDVADITTARGDLIMGASLNMIYALTDVIAWDEETCSVVRDTQLVWGSDEINTTYLYTENHVRNTLLPQLNLLRTLASPDSAILLQTYIDVWQQVLANNERQKEKAQKIKNISFSAGSTYEFSETTTRDTTTHVDFTIFIDSNLKIAAKIETGLFNETEFGVAATFRWSQTDVRDTTESGTTTIGYVLSDDDAGDFFSVDIKNDKEYGTLVFDLVNGTSSCPWEPGTQPRDGPSLNINAFEQFDIDPGKPAAFILGVGNISESDETRDYKLSLIQSSNLDGAIVRIGGVVVEDALSYSIPAGEQVTATLSVERGPVAYDYENIKLRLYSECDPSFADTINFSVHYRSPGSDVALFRPENNWLVNQASDNSLTVIIRDYDLQDENLESISLQYRKTGENWKTTKIFQKNEITQSYINFDWDLKAVPDGKYELRAASNSGSAGVNYSAVMNGVIDRSNLLVFGRPQPADGVLNIGEDILINFTAQLNCPQTPGNNIKLVHTDSGEEIPVTVACSERSLIITPLVDISTLEGKRLTATVKNMFDVNGNPLKSPVSWQFTVNQNAVYWVNSNAHQVVYAGETGSFSSPLSNSGGLTADFTISSLPAWLSAEPMSGSITAGGSLDIRFTVDNSLNNGVYADSAYVTVSGQAAEILTISLTVLEAPPSWQVMPAAYQYSMNVIAQISNEGNVSANDKDIVAAFVGNNIRGKANVQFVSDEAGYLAFLTVYSNQASGEKVSFRTWDATRSVETGFVTQMLDFENNVTLGELESPITLSATGRAQNINLNPDWTWFSLNLEYEDMSVNSVLGALAASGGDVIKGQSGISTYTGQTWVGDLDTLEVGKSYRIFLKDKQDLRFAGKVIDLAETKIPVLSGWNWLGYLRQENAAIDTALSAFKAADGDVIKSQTGFSVYDATGQKWQGGITDMKPGEGYLLKASGNGSFNFADASGAAKKQSALNGLAPVISAAVNLRPQDFEFNMSLIGAIHMGGTTISDDHYFVSAYHGDALRGRGELIYYPDVNKHLLFMTIYGNNQSGDSLRFEISNTSDGILLPVVDKLIFTSDGIAGSVDNPYALSGFDDVAPGIRSAFLYSTEPGLADHVRLYVTASEPLRVAPLVRVVSPTGTQNALETTVFDMKERIYQTKFKVTDFGENTFYITASDLAENLTQEIKKLNVQNIRAGEDAMITLNEQATLFIKPESFGHSGMFFGEYTETATDRFNTDLERVSEIFTFSANIPVKAGFSLSYDMSKVAMSEADKRKISLYQLDTDNNTWQEIGGQGTKDHFELLIKQTGTYALFYNEEKVPVPMSFNLHQNYPNPFNPVTTVRFDLPEAADVSLVIYDVLGQKVNELVNGKYEAGYHQVEWNGISTNGFKVASGVYIYQIRAGKELMTKKMVLLK